MSMPKATVHVDSRTIFRQNYIRMPRHARGMHPKPKTLPMEQASNQEFGLSVLGTNTGHHPATRSLVDHINHIGPSSSLDLSCHRKIFQWQLGIFIPEKLRHQQRRFPNDGHRNRIAKLLVSTCIRNRNSKSIGQPHQTRALTRRQSPRVLARLLDQNFRTILVVTRRKCPCNVFSGYKAESKAIALCLVLRRVVLEIGPQMIGQRKFRNNPPLRMIKIAPLIPR